MESKLSEENTTFLISVNHTKNLELSLVAHGDWLHGESRASLGHL